MAKSSHGSSAWRHVGRFLLVAHLSSAPTDEEWNEIIEHLRTLRDLDRLRILVYTAGGAPDARQRALLRTVLENRALPISVLTHSVVARVAGTALRFFHPQLHVFGSNEIERALDHLRAEQSERPAVKRALEELCESVGVSSH